VSVLLGNGDGTFQSPLTSTVAANPASLAVGDFNRDGKLDLAMTNSYPTNSVSVLLNGAPCLAATPSSGYPTQPVTLSGVHFGAGEAVGIYWDTTSSIPYTITADATGAFTTTPAVPQATSGAHTVIAVGQHSGARASIPFQVTPILQLSAASGKAGTAVGVVGGGFGLTTGAGSALTETVSLYWLPGATVLATTTSGIAGPLAGSIGPLTVTVPSQAAPGSYSVCGLGHTSGVATCRPFTVTAG
jgi:hypothetical protein